MLPLSRQAGHVWISHFKTAFVEAKVILVLFCSFQRELYFYFSGLCFSHVFLFKGASRSCLNTKASPARRHSFKWVMLHVEFSCCRQLPFSKASLCSTNGFQSFDTARLLSLCFFGVEEKEAWGSTPTDQNHSVFVLKCLLFICHYKIPSRSINSTLGRNYNTKLYKSFTNKKKTHKKNRDILMSVCK